MSAPERIWAASVTENYGEWQTTTDGLPRPTEYVRADIVTARIAALEAQLAELKAENERLLGVMETVREAVGYAYDNGQSVTTLLPTINDLDNALEPAAPEAPMDKLTQAREALHLTEYEIQVLLGTSIHGCTMSPDRVFSLDMAWHRLRAIGLIDRADGLAIATEKGREVVARILAALSDGEAVEPVAWRFQMKEWGENYWHYFRTEPKSREDDEIWQPLFASPPDQSDAALRERVAELEKDAARYRWLRNPPEGLSNRWPHTTQYPHQPEIDEFKPPQITREWRRKGEYLDEAIDAALSATREQLLSRHARATEGGQNDER